MDSTTLFDQIAAGIDPKTLKRRIRIEGIVLPERKAFKVEYKPFLTRLDNEFGRIEGIAEIVIEQSRLTCTFLTNSSIPDFDTFLNGIKYLIEFNVNAIAFVYNTSIIGVDIVNVYDSETDITTLYQCVTQAETREHHCLLRIQ